MALATAISTLDKLLSADYVYFGDFWTIPYLHLGVKDCNANTFANFSTDVTLTLDISSKYSERTYLGTYLSEIYMNGLLKVLCKAKGNYSNIVNQSQRKAVEGLLQYVEVLTSGGSHVQCLRKLQCLIDDNKALDEESLKHTESVIQAVLACHVFSPLLCEGRVIVDNRCYRSSHGSSDKYPKPETECMFCKKCINQANTNFGCKDLWHGRADIVIKTGKLSQIVKVTCNYKEMEEEDGSGEPSSKSTKLESADCSTTGVQPETYRFCLAEVKPVFDEDFCTYLTRKAYKQVISQTMINSFLASKLHSSSGNLLVPSFLVCQNSVFINFFDAENDVLLVQSKPMHFFEGKDEINIDAFFSLWMALNSALFPSEMCADFYRTAEKSGFKVLLENFGVLKKYQNEICSGFPRAQEVKAEKLPQKYGIDPDKLKLIEPFFTSLV